MEFRICDHAWRKRDSWLDTARRRWVEYECGKCGVLERSLV